MKSVEEGDFEPYGASLSVQVTTENPNDPNSTHGVFFNRGLTGARYVKKFGSHMKYHMLNKFGDKVWKQVINPRKLDPASSKEAREWLSRGLEEALIGFIAQAKDPTYRLLGAVYEFTHVESIDAFAKAVERGVDVKIVRHCKGSYRPKKGKNGKEWIPDSTTESAAKAIDSQPFAKLEDAHKWQHGTFIERKHASGISHNKFIILVCNNRPLQVWTGSTNFTDGGIYGQLNVGHIVRDKKVALQYHQYWTSLAKDIPGRRHAGGDGIQPMDVRNEELQPDLSGPLPLRSIKVMFSPRPTAKMLDWFAERVGEAKTIHFTAAFGVSQPIARVLNGTAAGVSSSALRRSPRLLKRASTLRDGCLRYVLLDNKPSLKTSQKLHQKKPGMVDYYDFRSNETNKIAFGALLDKGSSSEDESLTGLNTFVDFVHTKVLLVDALSDEPLVVTGSANFSEASLEKNDENMLFVKGKPSVRVFHFRQCVMCTMKTDQSAYVPGNTSLADIYLTEYVRVFEHYYSRDMYNRFVSKDEDSDRAWGEPVTDESWTVPYFDPSTQLYKERLLYR